jgi:hypothetical protein
MSAGTSDDCPRSAFYLGEVIMQPSFLENAENCDELASQAHGPKRTRLERLAKGWRAVAESQDWLDGRMPPVGIWLMEMPHQEGPGEIPQNDPRQQTDWPGTKQTDEPWKDTPEKD